MTPRQLGTAIVTGLGFWLLVGGVTHLAAVPYYVLSEPSSSPLHAFWIPGLVGSVINGVTGMVVIGLREPLSRRFFPGDSTIALPSEADFVAALLAVMGVYFAATAITDALPAEVSHWIKTQLESGAEVPDYLREIGPGPAIDVVRSRLWGVARLVAGVILFVGSGSLARTWQGLRAVGHNQQ